MLFERASTEEAGSGFHAAVAAHKRVVIREALNRSSGNVAEAARALGLQPTYLHRLIRNLGVHDSGIRVQSMSAARPLRASLISRRLNRYSARRAIAAPGSRPAHPARTPSRCPQIARTVLMMNRQRFARFTANRRRTSGKRDNLGPRRGRFRHPAGPAPESARRRNASARTSISRADRAAVDAARARSSPPHDPSFAHVRRAGQAQTLARMLRRRRAALDQADGARGDERQRDEIDAVVLEYRLERKGIAVCGRIGKSATESRTRARRRRGARRRDGARAPTACSCPRRAADPQRRDVPSTAAATRAACRCAALGERKSSR